MKSTFEILQPLGRALMLPIAVLPVAGILLRLGQPDLLDIAFIAEAGNAIFHNLGLLFAAGVAVGLAKENHGAEGLAGVVCFLVAQAGAKTLMLIPPEAVAGFTGKAADLAISAAKDAALFKLSVPTGIVSGLIAGWLYNRFHAIKLPISRLRRTPVRAHQQAFRRSLWRWSSAFPGRRFRPAWMPPVRVWSSSAASDCSSMARSTGF
jgi:PTS system N-acetylglucosamine-specific IIC component